jgi:tetratricopeptide (TPR) repeat protein
VLAGAAVALVGNLATNAVEPPDSWRWWPWTVWGVAALLIGGSVWIEYRRRHGTAADLDEVVAALLAPIGNGWAREAVRREVTRPAPVRVRWSSTGRPAADRQAVLGDPYAGGWREFPLSGATDALNDEIVAAFRGLPRRQLVVLGGPGAGKSVFALLLTLGLIRDRVDGEPLPLLVAINGWHPADPLDDFLARRLAEDHKGILSRYGDALELARRLIEQNRVLPLLDGLDELPAPAVATAFGVLDDYASAGRPLVVTCRVREYEKAGRILTTAAVVELEPVSAVAAVVYLAYPESARARWKPVFSHLIHAGPGDPLVRTLSTPLMVALARTAYRDEATDPMELLRLKTRPEAAARLLDAFLRATYPGEKQRRWLGTLAYHLYTAGTRDLRWWQLDPGLLTGRPDRARRWVVIVAALVAALLAGVAGYFADLWVPWAMASAVIVVWTAATERLRATWPPRYPRTAFSPERSFLPLTFWAGLIGGVLVGFMTSRWTAALTGGVICGALAAAWVRFRTAGRTSATESGADSRSGVRPAGLPRPPTGSDSRSGVRPAGPRGEELRRRVVAFTVVPGLVFGAVANWTSGAPVLVGTVAAVLYGSTAALCGDGWTRVRFRLAHARLAARGWLPWRLESFLADAHRRGLLRRPGAVYQFRHVLLQDRLATAVRMTDLEMRAIAGHIPAVRALAELLDEGGGTDRAVEALTWVADRDARSADRLAVLLARERRIGELRRRADHGDAAASRVLADVLVERGEIDELRDRAASGDAAAHARELALLAQQGDVDALQARAAAGDPGAALHLADLHVAAGRRDEAVTLLEGANGDPAAGRRLAGLREESGDIRGAVDILWDLSNAGDAVAAARLADLWMRIEELDSLWVAAVTGEPRAAERLSRFLYDQGDVESLHSLAGMRVAAASARRADLLVDLSSDDEYRNRLRSYAVRGDPPAARGMARVLAAEGRTAEAIDFLRTWADLQDGATARQLAGLLARQGDVDEAIAILRPRAEDGDEKAAEQLDALQRTDQE